MPKQKMKINTQQGKHLNQLLKEQGITQKELANRICVSPAVVSQWVKSIVNIPPNRIAQIVEIYSSDDLPYSREWLEGKTEYRSAQDETFYEEYRNEIRRELQYDSAMFVLGTVSHYDRSFYAKTIFTDGDSAEGELSTGDDNRIPKCYEFHAYNGDYSVQFSADEMRKIAFEVYQYAKTKLQIEIEYKRKKGF